MTLETEQAIAPRACPVCGGGEKSLIYRQSFSALSSGSLLEKYNVVSCRGCGCCFADEIPPQSVFDSYYSEMSKYECSSDTEDTPANKRRFASIAAILKEFLVKRETRVLEIGCAKTLAGKAIIRPEELKQRAEAILISSRAYQNEIKTQIRESLGCTNPVVLLYDL